MGAMQRAFENGVTHFDVARSYGFGEAEKILGEFARGRRDRITIATKFGILPASHSRTLSLIKPLIRPVFQRFPGLRSSAAGLTPSLLTSGFYSVDQARHSIETSLRELATDYIDILFVHDCTAEHELSEALLSLLDGLLAQGMIRAWGLATQRRWMKPVLQKISRAPQVVQCERALWASSGSNADACALPCIYHSPFEEVLRTLSGENMDSFRLLVDWADRNGKRINNAAFMRWVLETVFHYSQESVVLCSMFEPEHIDDNVAALSEPALDEKQISEFFMITRLIMSEMETKV